MRLKRPLTLPLIAVALLLTTALATAAEINWYSIDNGGGLSGAGGIQLVGVIGQTDTIRMTGGSISLSGGYLPLPPQGDELFRDGFE